MIFRIVWILRIIAVCLIVFFVLDYLLKWNIGGELLIIVPFFLLVYVMMSMIAVFVRFRRMSRPVPKIPPPSFAVPKPATDGEGQQEDEKNS